MKPRRVAVDRLQALRDVGETEPAARFRGIAFFRQQADAGFDEATVWVKGNLPDDLKAAYRDAIQAMIHVASHAAQAPKPRAKPKTKRGGRTPRRSSAR